MVTHDFQCQDPLCEEIFEVSHPMNETPQVKCPACGSEKTRKIILSAPGIFVYWRNTLGLGSNGIIILPGVKNKRLQKKVDAERKLKSRRRKDGEDELRTEQTGA